MKFIDYPVNLTKQKKGGFLVRFPDFPEAITQGETIEDAIEQAKDCLEEALVNRIVMKLGIPPASPIKRKQHHISISEIYIKKIARYIQLHRKGIAPSLLRAQVQRELGVL